jgi:hypothetical protein
MLDLALVASGYGNCRERTHHRLKQSRKRQQRIGFPAIGSKALLVSILIVRPLMFRGTAGGSS